eukprot:4922368-Heterocapsa_arctica.AAC.1
MNKEIARISPVYQGEGASSGLLISIRQGADRRLGRLLQGGLPPCHLQNGFLGGKGVLRRVLRGILRFLGGRENRAAFLEGWPGG